jgi:hypothetical protein
MMNDECTLTALSLIAHLLSSFSCPCVGQGKGGNGWETEGNGMGDYGREHDTIVRQLGPSWGTKKGRGSAGPNGVFLCTRRSIEKKLGTRGRGAKHKTARP